MARIPTARDALTAFKVTLSVDGDLIDAIERVVRKRSFAAPVADEDGKVVGVLTETDCLRLLTEHCLRELVGQRVGDHMSTFEAALDSETDLFTMADSFLASDLPVLPVLEGGRPVGRVVRWDLLKQIRALDRQTLQERGRQEHETEVLEHPSSIEGMQQRLAGSREPEEHK